MTNKGFSAIGIIIAIVLAVTAIGGGIYFVANEKAFNGIASNPLATSSEVDYSFSVPPNFTCPIVGFGEWKNAIPSPTDPTWCNSYSEIGDYDLYWSQRAEIEKDQRYCSMIDYDSNRWNCYNKLAKLKLDVRICKAAINKWDCESNVYKLFVNSSLANQKIQESFSPIADKVIQALKTKDMNALSELIHPTKGVYFAIGWNFPKAPSSTNFIKEYSESEQIKVTANHRFTKEQLVDAMDNQDAKLFWTKGYQPPESLKFNDFFNRYIFYSYSDVSKTKLLESIPMVGRINRDGSTFLLNPGAMAIYEIPALKNPDQIFSTSHSLLFELYNNQWFLIATSQSEFDLGDTIGD